MGWFSEDSKAELKALHSRCDLLVSMHKAQCERINELAGTVKAHNTENKISSNVLFDSIHRMNDIQRALIDHLGLKVVVNPPQSSSVTLVKKGKK